MENSRKSLISYESFAPKILFRFKASCQQEMSEHADDYLLLAICLSGKGQMVVDGNLYELKKGDIAIVNPGERHSIPKANAVFGYVGYDNIWLDGMIRNAIPKQKTLVSPEKYEKEMASCIANIVKLVDKKETGWDVLANVICVELLLWVLKEILPGEKETQEEAFRVESYERESIVKMMMAYFNKNYMNHISMMEMAKGAYLSTTYLTRIFKDYCKQSPIDYLISVRLKHACEMLEQEQLSVQETAKAVGYDDPYYFSKLFSKHVGVSPSQYKKGIRPEK